MTELTARDRAAAKELFAKLKAAGTGCGDCNLCCTLMAVEMQPLADETKPDRTPCKHLCKKGCGVYENKPDACTGFFCWWLILAADEDERLRMPAEWRPDRIGAVTNMNESGTFIIKVKHENAWKRPGPLQDYIRSVCQIRDVLPLFAGTRVMIERPSGHHVLMHYDGKYEPVIPIPGQKGPNGDLLYRTLHPWETVSADHY